LINALLISVRVMEEEIDVLVIVQYFWNPAASPIRIKDYDDDNDDDNEDDDDDDEEDEKEKDGSTHMTMWYTID
jgi:ABC-type Zn2+ transport system substrate-binding protein/surface adhesin